MTDVVKGVLQPKTLNYKWRIERFFADCTKVGDSYSSPAFSVQHPDKISKWYIRVYPKGVSEKDNNAVIIYLNCAFAPDAEVTVDFQFIIVSKKKKLPTPGKVTATYRGSALGYRFNLAKPNLLQDAKYDALADDTLEIICEISFHPIFTSNSFQKHLEKYEQFLEKDYFSDVTFNIQGEKMYVHKAIVASGSPVFQAMFEHDMKEKKEGSVDITDIDYGIMKELFRFIYSSKVENIENIAKDLWIAADKYAVTELKALCEKTMCHNLTVDNAIEYLKLTEMYDTIHLKTNTMNFVVEHYEKVVVKSEFEELPSTMMCEIIRAVALKK